MLDIALENNKLEHTLLFKLVFDYTLDFCRCYKIIRMSIKILFKPSFKSQLNRLTKRQYISI